MPVPHLKSLEVLKWITEHFFLTNLFENIIIQGVRVWIPDDKHGFVPGTVEGAAFSAGDDGAVKLDNGEVRGTNLLSNIVMLILCRNVL